jgi:probable HAF family extracellular repeat protein
MMNCSGVGRLLTAVLILVFGANAAEAPNVTFTFTNIAVRGATATFVNGINNGGVLVGSYSLGLSVSHGFTLKGTKLTILDDPKGKHTSCEGINATGDVVGTYFTSTGTRQAFLHHGGKFTDIGPTGPRVRRLSESTTNCKSQATSWM